MLTRKLIVVKLKKMVTLSIRLAPLAQDKPFLWEVRPPGRSDLLRKSSGQALLIVLLIMAVGLTIGLSVISRSVTDIKISQQTEEAARAFSAAEAGIESALLIGESTSGSFPETGASYQATAVGIGGGTEFAFPSQYDTNDPQVLWLSNQDFSKAYDQTALRVLWGNSDAPSDDNNTPALEVTVYYKDGSNFKAGKFALDPYSGRSPDPSFCNPGEGGGQCQGVSNFIATGEGAEGKNFKFAVTLDLSGFRGGSKTLILARLRLLFSPDTTKHLLGAKRAGSGSTNFPSQGNRIDSTGTAGTATRKVEVVRFYPAPPAIFDSVLYSQGGLVKP